MGKKIRRVVGILLLMTAVLITQLPTPEMSAASADDFQIKDTTLIKYTGTASTVSVSDTVKIIGEEAFAGNLSVNTVSCGKNVKEIMHGAFANCTYLTKVEIPDTVEKIDSAAFSGCENLSHLNIGKNVKELGQGAFAGCNSLKSVIIDENNPYFILDNGALYNRDRTILYAYFGGNESSSYIMPDSVEKIYSYAFWGNPNLESITLSSSLNEIPGYAFSNCKNLQGISIPYSVHNIDAKAFENCISLTDATIPPSVSYIHPTAFDGCNRLNIIADAGSVADTFFQTFEKSDVEIVEEDDTKQVVVSSDPTSVSEDDSDDTSQGTLGDVYYSNPALKDASDDPSNVEYMPKTDPLSGLEDSDVIAKTIIVDGNAVLFLNRDVNINQGMVIKDSATDSSVAQDNGEIIYDPQKGGYLPKYTVVNNKIASQAFYALRDMQDYIIPDEIQEIGDFAFARSNISEAVIPDNTTTIGYGAFYCCDNLNNATIPENVETIKAYAFDNTAWLNNWKSNADSSDFLIVGNDILLAYKGTSNNIEIPEGVKKIAPGCFKNHTEIQSVYLPDSLKTIGEDAFRECTNLAMITGGNYIENIEDRAFMQCPLSTFTIPSTVKQIGLRAIDYTDTSKQDNTKTVIFAGNILPEVSYGTTSQRLQNEDYRKDALYNVLFAVVPDSVTEFEHTVLDGTTLGFSGMIISIEKDESGNETGNVIVKESHIFSDMVLEQLPKTVVIRGKEYNIKDFDNISLATEGSDLNQEEKSLDVKTLYNLKESDDFSASFSENEQVGILYITDNDNVKQKMEAAYGELFGDSVPNMKGYDIVLKDETDTLPITRFGKAELAVNMKIPDDITGETYHVICMDNDGQLEEVNTKVNAEDGMLTFYATHLSDYAVYATGNETTTLNIKNGKLVNNLKKDASPNTGDSSFPIKYVLAVAVMCCGLLCFFWKKRVTT